ncbi:hypothetical protein [Campylobacter rectus]|uniref:hypothetical protein n=1 Tax=Campylobacter rectus TaxID=203 RepID=UPI000F5F1FB5|nr:hypothetical protein [Campylobacter rectus]RRD54191.1 hypothetical protein EII16_06975 [Campylobacter rectus]
MDFDRQICTAGKFADFLNFKSEIRATCEFLPLIKSYACRLNLRGVKFRFLQAYLFKFYVDKFAAHQTAYHINLHV